MASSNKRGKQRSYWTSGEPYVWATAIALTLTLACSVVLVGVIAANGLGALWPHRVALIELQDGTRLAGEIVQREAIPEDGGQRLQLKVGNRDLYQRDFRWVDESAIRSIEYPGHLLALEREEHGNFYGFLLAEGAGDPASNEANTAPSLTLEGALAAIRGDKERLEALAAEIMTLNRKMDRLRRQEGKLTYEGVASGSQRFASIDEAYERIKTDFDALLAQQTAETQAYRAHSVLVADAAGTCKPIPLAAICRYYQPNAMPVGAKLAFYASKIAELFVAQPRESNTEGGLFPAIFGTVMLIFVMSILSFPFGVMAGVYLREYAKDGPWVRIVRIAVNNLAGIPSIVYGIFGLGFFVYGMGGSIDRLFFADRLPAPTFGSGGILWASLTLGLLTVPVVIVSTEEALGAIPKGIREGSLALGATRYQTLYRTLLPIASPGIMTGFILAMARAAGEVAPLMITGVVKLAPSLPLDGQFPYLHLERKFMHLGFHIYDIGFQSPNVEAAKPMVYITTLFLVLIVLLMSSIAIWFRTRMRKRYSASGL